MLPESSFQPEHNNMKQSIVLQVAQIPHEAKDKLSSLLEEDYNSIVSKSPTDVGRTNLFKIDISTAGLPIACKLYLIPLKYQKFTDKEIRLFENAECISKRFESMGHSSNYSAKETRSLKSSKATALLSVRLTVT